MDEIEVDIKEQGAEAYMRDMNQRLLGRPLRVMGRCIVDDQGAMFIAEGIESTDLDAKEEAVELRKTWGVI